MANVFFLFIGMLPNKTLEISDLWIYVTVFFYNKKYLKFLDVVNRNEAGFEYCCYCD